MSVERVEKLGEAILALLDEDTKKHGPSLETYSIQVDTMAGVVHATVATVAQAATPTIAAALATRFKNLVKLDKAVEIDKESVH